MGFWFFNQICWLFCLLLYSFCFIFNIFFLVISSGLLYFFSFELKTTPEFIVYIRIQSWFYTYLGFGQIHDDLLKKEMSTHSSTLALRIPWTEESGGLQSMGSQRVGHDWATNTHTHTHTHTHTMTYIHHYRVIQIGFTDLKALCATPIIHLSYSPTPQPLATI